MPVRMGILDASVRKMRALIVNVDSMTCFVNQMYETVTADVSFLGVVVD
jgi:hypothetical protein